MLELIIQGRAKYHKMTRADGTFVFNKVPEGYYTIRARFGDFVIVQDDVTVTGRAKNFAAVMLPKRWVKAPTFRTVTADQLAAQSDHELQKSLRKASALAAKQDFAGAARLYEKAVTKGAQPGVWDALGLLYLQMGKKDQAFQAFEKAIARDPQYLFPYVHLGTVYLEEGRFKDLLAVANRALAADSKWLTAYEFLAEAQIGMGNPEAAEQSVETASGLVRGRAPGPYLLLAKVRWARRDCVGARKYMERYLELNTSARERSEILGTLERLRGCGPAPTP
jgi:tetratricopeptide (TPR) repeat protein